MGGSDMGVKLIDGSGLVSALNLAKTVIHFLVYNLNRGIPMTDEDIKKVNETIKFFDDIIEQAKV